MMDIDIQELISKLRNNCYSATQQQRDKLKNLTIRNASAKELEEMLNILQLRGLSSLVEKLQVLGTGKGSNPSYWDGDRSILRVLPENIGTLTFLKKLDLQYHQLKTLPASIGALSKLEELDLSDNFLTEIPESIGNCTALRILNVESNRILVLPESLGRCTALVALHMSNNNLLMLPESLMNCVALQEINVRESTVVVLPASLMACTALSTINIGDCKLVALPASLAECTAFKLYPHEECLLVLPESQVPDIRFVEDLSLKSKDSLDNLTEQASDLLLARGQKTTFIKFQDQWRQIKLKALNNVLTVLQIPRDIMSLIIDYFCSGGEMALLPFPRIIEIKPQESEEEQEARELEEAQNLSVALHVQHQPESTFIPAALTTVPSTRPILPMFEAVIRPAPAPQPVVVAKPIRVAPPPPPLPPVVVRPAIVPQAQAEAAQAVADEVAQRVLRDKMRAGSRLSTQQASVSQPVVVVKYGRVAPPPPPFPPVVPAIVPQAQAAAARKREVIRDEQATIAAAETARRAAQKAANLAAAAAYLKREH